MDFSTARLPSSVCSISGGPLVILIIDLKCHCLCFQVNHLLIKPTDVKRNQLKKSVSIKSSSSSVSTPDRQSKIVRPSPIESIPQEKLQRSKEEEAEDAAELQQEIDQLLTSLNLEKPSTIYEEENANEETSQLENVARTLYDCQKTQVTINEKKETPNLIDRLLISRSVQIPKYSSFNPFPSRSFNENVAVNGYKLGLYAPDATNR
jgi:hypothetical protein